MNHLMLTKVTSPIHDYIVAAELLDFRNRMFAKLALSLVFPLVFLQTPYVDAFRPFI